MYVGSVFSTSAFRRKKEPPEILWVSVLLLQAVFGATTAVPMISH